MDQQLFQKIFGREEDTPGNRGFLDDIMKRYPYFGPAHFYSLKESTGDEERFQKSSLYFNDLFLLNSLLNQHNIETPVQQHLQEDKKEEHIAVVEETVAAPEDLSPKEEVPVGRLNDQAIEQYAGTQNIYHPEPAAETPGRLIDIANERSVPEQPLFEPLHATDYFASQGIKLSENVLGNDKLGQQLKSFTAWLKTMKKVQGDRLPPVSAAGEAAVQNLAEKSNREEDVLTEAMAEVYAQQGKTEKAIETYTKLSLLNPSKSAYFAAKIESLK